MSRKDKNNFKCFVNVLYLKLIVNTFIFSFFFAKKQNKFLKNVIK